MIVTYSLDLKKTCRAGIGAAEILCCCTLMGLFFLSCSKVQVTSENAVIAVKAATVAERRVPDTISGFGSLSFITKVDIASPQDGKLKRLYCREGDWSAAGSTVVLLDNPQISLAVRRAEDGFAQAEASLRLVRARLSEGEYAAEAELLNIAKAEAELKEGRRVLTEERRKQGDTEKLYEAGGLSDEAIRESRFNLESAEERLRLMERELEIRKVGRREVDLAAAGLLPPDGFSPVSLKTALIRLATLTLRAEAEAAAAQLEASRRELEAARLAFAELSVTSPVSGIVGARYVEEGERVRRDDKLLTLIDTGSLYAVFSVRETDALRLRKSMAAEVSVDGTGRTYTGTVELISPQADSQSFTFNVRVIIPAENDLKPGMFARVLVKAGEDRVRLTVPGSAVINKKNGEGSLFVVLNGQVSERNIKLGENLENGEYEVLSGIVPGEVIVIDSDGSLKEGSRVILER
jgi:multidrug efflux pump subunit AcrA (membrane-fusion protein)